MNVEPWMERAYENFRAREDYKMREARRWEESHGSGDSSDVVGTYFDDYSGGYRPVTRDELDETGARIYGTNDLDKIGRRIYGN